MKTHDLPRQQLFPIMTEEESLIRQAASTLLQTLHVEGNPNLVDLLLLLIYRTFPTAKPHISLTTIKAGPPDDPKAA